MSYIPGQDYPTTITFHAAQPGEGEPDDTLGHEMFICRQNADGKRFLVRREDGVFIFYDEAQSPPRHMEA